MYRTLLSVGLQLLGLYFLIGGLSNLAGMLSWITTEHMREANHAWAVAGPVIESIGGLLIALTGFFLPKPMQVDLEHKFDHALAPTLLQLLGVATLVSSLPESANLLVDMSVNNYGRELFLGQLVASTLYFGFVIVLLFYPRAVLKLLASARRDPTSERK